jgi:SAM-dependent methyltransferase
VVEWRGPVDYDAELQRHQEVLRRAWGIEPHEHVLDIGCGSGQSTREAALTAASGRALGVDISASAIGRARELARAQSVRNVTFECADARVYPFPQARFDVAISRFGTMFFGADSAAAFSHIGRALRPGGRLVMMVWQAAERNEWAVATGRALAGSGGSPDVDAGGAGAFSLGNSVAVRKILNGAGYGDVAFADVDQPVYYGPDVAAALEWVRGFASTREALSRLEPAGAERALGRLRETLAAHLGGGGVWFGSRAWIVTARRR